MNHYRFSISWPRVLPDGDVANINKAGIDYYNKVINKILDYGIEPMVTMYHWDLPRELQKFGGWTNPLIIRYFEAYANLLFEQFGDRVKYWITFNEPNVFCQLGYGSFFFPPAIDAHGVGEYLCAHHVIQSHTLVYRSYRQTYFEQFKGKIGITINSEFFYSKTNNTEHVDRAMHFSVCRILFEFYYLPSNDCVVISAGLVCKPNFRFGRRLSSGYDLSGRQ